MTSDKLQQRLLGRSQLVTRHLLLKASLVTLCFAAHDAACGLREEVGDDFYLGTLRYLLLYLQDDIAKVVATTVEHAIGIGDVA